MNTYRISVAYDGSNYFGWQAQPKLPTIETTLKKIFSSVFGHSVAILGASRTDAGVHAAGQVARCITTLDLDSVDIMRAWNNALPSDIVIRSMERVIDFHPFYNVDYKIYYYHFFLKRPLPFFQQYGWFFRYSLDINKLNNALRLFVGTHDFRSFCTGNGRENTVRTIDVVSLDYFRKYNAYRITIKGHSFLQHMIRRIVGACLDVASQDNLSLDYLTRALEKKDPKQTLLNAPAKGLLLRKIVYNTEDAR